MSQCERLLTCRSGGRPASSFVTRVESDAFSPWRRGSLSRGRQEWLVDADGEYIDTTDGELQNRTTEACGPVRPAVRRQR
jgi:hypothetical protein